MFNTSYSLFKFFTVWSFKQVLHCPCWKFLLPIFNWIISLIQGVPSFMSVCKILFMKKSETTRWYIDNSRHWIIENSRLVMLENSRLVLCSTFISSKISWLTGNAWQHNSSFSVRFWWTRNSRSVTESVIQNSKVAYCYHAHHFGFRRSTSNSTDFFGGD